MRAIDSILLLWAIAMLAILMLLTIREFMRCWKGLFITPEFLTMLVIDGVMFAIFAYFLTK